MYVDVFSFRFEFFAARWILYFLFFGFAEEGSL
jgi:hypothetical protein